MCFSCFFCFFFSLLYILKCSEARSKITLLMVLKIPFHEKILLVFNKYFHEWNVSQSDSINKYVLNWTLYFFDIHMKEMNLKGSKKLALLPVIWKFMIYSCVALDLVLTVVHLDVLCSICQESHIPFSLIYFLILKAERVTFLYIFLSVPWKILKYMALPFHSVDMYINYWHVFCI